MYVRRVTRSTICTNKLHFISLTGERKNSTVAFGSIPNKIHYFDYPERYNNIINEVYDCLTVCLLQSHLLLCWHGFCERHVM